MLRGLGLLLAHDAQHGHEAHVHNAHVLRPHAELELAQRLHEGHALDVAHGAAELDDAHGGDARAAVHRHVAHALYPLLDLVRHVRHHLRNEDR